jgi:hypothetical protein
MLGSRRNWTKNWLGRISAYQRVTIAPGSRQLGTESGGDVVRPHRRSAFSGLGTGYRMSAQSDSYVVGVEAGDAKYPSGVVASAIRIVARLNPYPVADSLGLTRQLSGRPCQLGNTALL